MPSLPDSHPGLASYVLHVLQGTLGPPLDKLLELGHCRSTDLCLPTRYGHPLFHLYLGGLWHSQWSWAHPQPKPGPQFTVLLGPGWGAKWSRFFLSSGSSWDLNLRTQYPQSSTLTLHLKQRIFVTESYTNICSPRQHTNVSLISY